MKNILFPTDFSENSENAFRYALHFAQALEANITSLHTYSMPLVPTNTPVTAYKQISENVNNSQIEDYRLFAQKLRKITEEEIGGEANLKHILERGFAVDEIVNLSEEQEMDLIVMGTKGASGWKEFLWGSNTGSVLDRVNCPVLVVPEQAAYKGIQRIVCAIHFETKEEELIQEVMQFAKLFNAKLSFVHVANPIEAWNKKRLDMFKELSQLATQFDAIDFQVVKNKEVTDGLETYAKECKADVIVMFQHKRSLLERLFVRSYSQEMSYHTAIPLLVYH